MKCTWFFSANPKEIPDKSHSVPVAPPSSPSITQYLWLLPALPASLSTCGSSYPWLLPVLPASLSTRGSSQISQRHCDYSQCISLCPYLKPFFPGLDFCSFPLPCSLHNLTMLAVLLSRPLGPGHFLVRSGSPLLFSLLTLFSWPGLVCWPCLVGRFPLSTFSTPSE